MKSIKIHTIESLSSDTKKVFDILNKESDLACVLIGVSFLDESLRTALHRYFIKSETAANLLHPSKGALGSYGIRCDIAYSLSIVSKIIFKDLKIIGEIRNLFAHSHLELSFGSKKVIELTNKLENIDMLKYTHIWQKVENPTSEDLYVNSRTRFVLSLVLIHQRIMVTGLGFKHTPMNK